MMEAVQVTASKGTKESVSNNPHSPFRNVIKPHDDDAQALVGWLW